MENDPFGIVGTTQGGSFRVESFVAEGGFGAVYRAHHSGFRAPVALKCLKVPETMTPEHRELFLEKFREEGELLFLLSASIPAVVRPLHVDALELGGRLVPFLALEWLEGEAFDRVLEKRRAVGKAPMNVHKLVRLLSPIADALARAHRFPSPTGPQSIVHRDLKPENIFVARINGADVVKILDFGIARTKSAAHQNAGRSTRGESLSAFTPGYAAPEQWLPKRFGQTGPWTDVWGLAITMVEALSGRPPIDGDVPAMMGTAMDERRRPTPRNEGVVVSDHVERAFEQALAVDPRDRTKDICTFWTALQASLGMDPTILAADRRRDRTGPAGLSEPPDSLGSLGARPEASTQRAPPPPAPSVGASVEPATSRADPLEFSLPDLKLDPPAQPPPKRSPVAPAKAIAPVPEVPNRAPRPLDRIDDLSAGLVESRAPLRAVRPVRGSLIHSADSGDSLGERLRTPLRLVLLAIAIGAADIVFARTTGDSLRLGDLRPVWVAGPIALVGVLLGFHRLITISDP